MPPRQDEELRELRGELNELSRLVAEGFATNSALEQNRQRVMDKLVKTVLDGNGGNSLLTENALLKREVRDLREAFEQHKQKQAARALEDRKGSWAVIVAVISGVCGLLAAAIQFLLGAMK